MPLKCPYCNNTEFIGPHRIHGFGKTVVEFSYWRTASIWGRICARCGYVGMFLDGYGLDKARKYGRRTT